MARKIQNDKVRRRVARKVRVSKGMRFSERVALTVYRSNKHIYAQLVDSETGRTLTSVSSRTGGVVDGGATGGIEAAKKVGSAIAERARERQIERVVFDRNGFLYHGRVKALAEAAREAGLQF
ncbi:MAG: 50S ribosomal protein L18 [Myxococcales bacterium]|nr:50S ribosomal protein L18 [Myxococcales bacterium]